MSKSSSQVNPFTTGFMVRPLADGSFVIDKNASHWESRSHLASDQEMWAFSNISDLMVFLSKASGSLVNPMQPSFDFRDHLKEPANGPAS